NRRSFSRREFVDGVEDDVERGRSDRSDPVPARQRRDHARPEATGGSRKGALGVHDVADGFVAGPGHTMDFMNRATTRKGLLEEYIEVTGAVLAGRDGYDSDVGVNPYGGRWQGPIFVLTHHPEDARPAGSVTFLGCSVEEAVRIGLEAAKGKNLQ